MYINNRDVVRLWSDAPVLFPSMNGENRRYYGKYEGINSITTSVTSGPKFEDGEWELVLSFLKEN